MLILLKNLSYQEHSIQIKLPTLKYRRLSSDLIEVFKNLKTFDTSVVPNLHFDKSYVIRGNKFKLIEDRISHDIRKYYFTVRITPDWNSLPKWVVEADTDVSIFVISGITVGAVKHYFVYNLQLYVTGWFTSDLN